jgi:hypothetical protein
MFSGKDQIYLKKHEVVLGKSESGRYDRIHPLQGKQNADAGIWFK